MSVSLVFDLFFFKQKTAYEMRISDWSSDVCSSDLAPQHLKQDRAAALRRHRLHLRVEVRLGRDGPVVRGDDHIAAAQALGARIGRSVDGGDHDAPRIGGDAE